MFSYTHLEMYVHFLKLKHHMDSEFQEMDINLLRHFDYSMIDVRHFKTWDNTLTILAKKVSMPTM